MEHISASILGRDSPYNVWNAKYTTVFWTLSFDKKSILKFYFRIYFCGVVHFPKHLKSDKCFLPSIKRNIHKNSICFGVDRLTDQGEQILFLWIFCFIDGERHLSFFKFLEKCNTPQEQRRKQNFKIVLLSKLNKRTILKF